MGEVSGIVYRLFIDLHNHVAGMEARFFRAAAFFNIAHQHAVTIFHAKEFTQLRGQVLDHQAAAHGGHRSHHRNSRNFNRCHVNLGHFHMKILHIAHGKFFVPVGQLQFDGKGRAVAAQAEFNDAAGRRLVDHPAQLGRAFPQALRSS